MHPSNDCTDSPPEMPQFTGVHASLPLYLPIWPLSIRWGDPAARPVRAGARSGRRGFSLRCSRGTWGRKHAVPPAGAAPLRGLHPVNVIVSVACFLLPPLLWREEGAWGWAVPGGTGLMLQKYPASAGGAGWETMPSFHPCPQRQPAACLRCYPAPPSLGNPRRGDGTKIPRF